MTPSSPALLPAPQPAYILVLRLEAGALHHPLAHPFFQHARAGLRAGETVLSQAPGHLHVLLRGPYTRRALPLAQDLRGRAARTLPLPLHLALHPLPPRSTPHAALARPPRWAVRVLPRTVPRQPAWKRAIDLPAAAGLLLLLSPLLLAMAALIKTTSPGPVLFAQTRIGFRGRPFTCWKFRSMKRHAATAPHREHVRALIDSDQPMTKLDSRHDPRLIPLGPLMRAAGLDELPQLINVLRGEMSLVGPRPGIPYEVEAYAPWQRRRLDALPGLTGLWQISGKNQTTFREMVALDIAYIQRLSPGLDAAILLRTPLVLLREGGRLLLRTRPSRPPPEPPGLPGSPASTDPPVPATVPRTGPA